MLKLYYEANKAPKVEHHENRKNMKNYLLHIAFVSLQLYAAAQDIAYKQFNYSSVDSFALSLHEQKIRSLKNLAETLTGRYNTDFEKARVIFRWITDNIAYDMVKARYIDNYKYSYSRPKTRIL